MSEIDPYLYYLNNVETSINGSVWTMEDGPILSTELATLIESQAISLEPEPVNISFKVGGEVKAVKRSRIENLRLSFVLLWRVFVG